MEEHIQSNLEDEDATVDKAAEYILAAVGTNDDEEDSKSSKEEMATPRKANQNKEIPPSGRKLRSHPPIEEETSKNQPASIKISNPNASSESTEKDTT